MSWNTGRAGSDGGRREKGNHVGGGWRNGQGQRKEGFMAGREHSGFGFEVMRSHDLPLTETMAGFVLRQASKEALRLLRGAWSREPRGLQGGGGEVKGTRCPGEERALRQGRGVLYWRRGLEAKPYLWPQPSVGSQIPLSEVSDS